MSVFRHASRAEVISSAIFVQIVASTVILDAPHIQGVTWSTVQVVQMAIFYIRLHKTKIIATFVTTQDANALLIMNATSVVLEDMMYKTNA